RLYWVDITERLVFAQDWVTGARKSLLLPETVGSVALRASGGLVAALRHGIAYCDVDTGAVETVRELETELAANRFNDGAVDPRGRFWFGSMDLAESTPTGAFYCLRADTSVARAFDGIVVSNGPAWSPDGSTMYHVDSARQIVTAYEFDVE